MSEDIAGKPPLVPGYAGHGDATARRLSDQQVRASVGEMLAGLRDRFPDEASGDRIEALLLRCEFADQHVVRAIEDERFAGPALATAVENHDRALVEAAAGAHAATGATELPLLLEALERAFDARAAAISAELER